MDEQLARKSPSLLQTKTHDSREHTRFMHKLQESDTASPSSDEEPWDSDESKASSSSPEAANELAHRAVL